LFLCTGNYYRSRFAEIYFNWLAEQIDLPWRADSRGLELDPNNPGHMSRFTIQRLSDWGITVDDYRRFPKDLSAADLKSAQHVVAVKQTEHRPLLAKRFPEWLQKVEFWEVHDTDVADPTDALPHLEQEVTALMERLRGSSSDRLAVA
jgi:protein-tyrosine phosphatase